MPGLRVRILPVAAIAIAASGCADRAAASREAAIRAVEQHLQRSLDDPDLRIVRGPVQPAEIASRRAPGRSVDIDAIDIGAATAWVYARGTGGERTQVLFLRHADGAWRVWPGWDQIERTEAASHRDMVHVIERTADHRRRLGAGDGALLLALLPLCLDADPLAAPGPKLRRLDAPGFARADAEAVQRLLAGRGIATALPDAGGLADGRLGISGYAVGDWLIDIDLADGPAEGARMHRFRCLRNDTAAGWQIIRLGGDGR